MDERRQRLVEYLTALRKKRLELLGGAQSYSVGSRSLARYNVELRDLTAEIARTERELAKLDGRPVSLMRRLYFKDY